MFIVEKKQCKAQLKISLCHYTFHESGCYRTFQEFLSKYNCKSNFLEYYQVLSAIPSFLSKKVGEMDNMALEGFVQGASSFMLDENVELNLEKL